MKVLYEKKSVSDHIQVAAFPSAKEKGELCAFGNLVGFSDYRTAQGESGSVSIGKYASVFQAAKADLPTAAIGMDVYVTSEGALASATAAGSKLLGTVVAVGSDTFDFAVTG